MLNPRVLSLILLLGPNLTCTPLRLTLGRVRKQVTVDMTLVILVPLLVLSSACLLAMTRLPFIQCNSLGNLLAASIARLLVESMTPALPQPLITCGPILPFDMLGSALIRVTKFTAGIACEAPVGSAVKRQLHLLSATLLKFTVLNLP